MDESETRLICPLTATTVEAMRAQMLAARAAGADAVECRLDFLTPAPDRDQLGELLCDAPLGVIVTCRAKRQGGHFAGEEAHRLAILAEAASHEAVVAADIEADTPAADRPKLDARVARILSDHDFATCPGNLDERMTALHAQEGEVSKIAVTARGPEDAFVALELLRDAPRPSIALAMGEAGLPSRVLAKKLGAWGSFAALHNRAQSAPGQPSLEDMRHLYRWSDIDAHTEVYGVVGCPIAHSMSPAVHNAAFADRRRNAVYLPLRVEPGGENFQRFFDAMLHRPWMDFRGLSITLPHKTHALEAVTPDACDELSARIGAINTVRIDADGTLRGTNTDAPAALAALCEAMQIDRAALADHPVAVLGAGGAARAIVAALAEIGSPVNIYNRTLARAEELAEAFGATALSLEHADQTEARVLINCTPIGMSPHADACPVSAISPAVRVVFDTIYNPLETTLLGMARSAGCTVVSGLDMFVHQAAAQYEWWTGEPAPEELMRRVVLDRLG